VRVLFLCLFYEEVQLVLDIRNKNLSTSRLYRFLIYGSLLIAYIATFGWAKFAIVFLGMRIVRLLRQDAGMVQGDIPGVAREAGCPRMSASYHTSCLADRTL